MTALGSSSMHSMHMFDAPIRLSIGAAWITRLMRWIYSGINSAYTGVFFLTISIPIGSFFYLVILYFNKRLASTFDINFSLDLKNCEQSWRRKEKLDKIIMPLRGIPTIALNKEAWYVRLFLKQLVIAVNAILLYHAELDKKFQLLDKPYSSLPPNMNVVTSQKLYSGRVKGYEYLV
jgi:hypothetical protein